MSSETVTAIGGTHQTSQLQPLRWIVVVVDAAAPTATVVAIDSCLAVVEMVTALVVVVLLVVVCVAAPNVLSCRCCCCFGVKNGRSTDQFARMMVRSPEKLKKQNTTQAAMAMTTMVDVADRLFS